MCVRYDIWYRRTRNKGTPDIITVLIIVDITVFSSIVRVVVYLFIETLLHE